jgi:hypothetical protein
MASSRFLALSRRAQELRHRFIPKIFSPTGTYSKRQRDLARAYRLLVHAEIEAYFEDRARDVALKAARKFRIEGKPRVVVMNLIGFHSDSRNATPEKIIQSYSRGINHLAESLDKAVESYMRMLSKNHGIRQFSILNILLPLGFGVSNIAPTLLATLDSFGANRGEVAHKSVKAQQQIDPKTELDTVSMIIKDLEVIDDKFSNLWKSC